jgi:hypothetical protein
VAGYRKVWDLLRRDVVVVARYTAERLMRQQGLHGAVRGRRCRTTLAHPALTSAGRPADPVQRRFRATAPNRLWCVAFTYVPTWSAMAFTAFVLFGSPLRVPSRAPRRWPGLGRVVGPGAMLTPCGANTRQIGVVWSRNSRR